MYTLFSTVFVIFQNVSSLRFLWIGGLRLFVNFAHIKLILDVFFLSKKCSYYAFFTGKCYWNVNEKCHFNETRRHYWQQSSFKEIHPCNEKTLDQAGMQNCGTALDRVFLTCAAGCSSIIKVELLWLAGGCGVQAVVLVLARMPWHTTSSLYRPRSSWSLQLISWMI